MKSIGACLKLVEIKTVNFKCMLKWVMNYKAISLTLSLIFKKNIKKFWSSKHVEPQALCRIITF